MEIDVIFTAKYIPYLAIGLYVSSAWNEESIGCQKGEQSY